MSRLWSRLWPARHTIAQQQLERAFPELSRETREAIADESFHHLVRVLAEVLTSALHPPDGRGGSIAFGPHQVELRGLEHLGRARHTGRGAIVLSGHLGNFELALHAAAQVVPLMVVTKKIQPTALDEFWRWLRLRRGLDIVDDYGSWSKIRGTLKDNGVVVMTLDQHAPPEHAVLTSFFGQDAWTHKGLATLAAHAGAHIVPAFAHRARPYRHVLAFAEPLAPPRRSDIAEATQSYTTMIEEAVRMRPAQWTWLHRRWKRT